MISTNVPTIYLRYQVTAICIQMTRSVSSIISNPYGWVWSSPLWETKVLPCHSLLQDTWIDSLILKHYHAYYNNKICRTQLVSLIIYWLLNDLNSVNKKWQNDHDQ
jgi:hypothetical protein